MLHVTTCAVCGGRAQRALVSFSNDPYLRRLPQRTRYELHYAVCPDCGFVFQREMMDAAEMETLYAGAYRRPEPSEPYLNDVRAVALDVCAWIRTRTGMGGAGRSALDIGCAAGMSLRPFALQGWTVVGLDPGAEWVEYGRREFGLDLHAEFFSRDALPGRRFDLVLYSHVIEHVLDPAPVLAAIREKLTDDGVLFIGTPNVLAPKRKLYPGLFGGDHVRLFSPRTLRAYLQRWGFKAVCVETHQPRGLRALAVKTESAEPGLPRERDDGEMIRALYGALFATERRSPLERNLAVLAEHQEPALDELCRWRPASPYRVTPSQQDPDNLEVVGPDGASAWLYGHQGSRARVRWALSRLPGRAPSAAIVIGLGLGHFAEALLSRWEPCTRLHIWEPDVARLAAVLHARDLTDLLGSPRVTLHLGPDMEFLRDRLGADDLKMLIRDPIMPAQRHPLGDEVEASVRALCWRRGAQGTCTSVEV